MKHLLRMEHGIQILAGSLLLLPIIALVVAYSKSTVLDLSVIMFWTFVTALGAGMSLIDLAEDKKE